jgi:hypothetical protein
VKYENDRNPEPKGDTVTVSSTPDANLLPDNELQDEELSQADTSLDETDRDPVGYLKYVPVVTFGLRAAALAGIAVSIGLGEAAALSGIFDGPHVLAGGGTTCCVTVAPR